MARSREINFNFRQRNFQHLVRFERGEEITYWTPDFMFLVFDTNESGEDIHAIVDRKRQGLK